MFPTDTARNARIPACRFVTVSGERGASLTSNACPSDSRLGERSRTHAIERDTSGRFIGERATNDKLLVLGRIA